MHYVSAQSEYEQLNSVYSFLRDHLEESVGDSDGKVFEAFDTKLEEFEENEDHLGLIEYLVSLKSALVSLPVTHKNSPITF